MGLRPKKRRLKYYDWKRKLHINETSSLIKVRICSRLQKKLPKKRLQILTLLMKERIRLYEQQLNLQVGEITQLSSENDVLTNNCERFKKEKNDLQNEIDRLRRKLSGGFGSDSNIQIQFNRLQKEYNDILRETRGQKKKSSETHNFSSNL